jgi:hypothetical protein
MIHSVWYDVITKYKEKLTHLQIVTKSANRILEGKVLGKCPL